MRFMVHMEIPEGPHKFIDANTPLELMDCLFRLAYLDKVYLIKVDVSSESGAGIWVQVAHTHNSTSKRRTEKIDEKQRHDPEYIDQLVGAIWERALSTRGTYEAFRTTTTKASSWRSSHE